MLPAVFAPHVIFIFYLTNHHIIWKFSSTLLWSDVFPMDS